MNRRMCAIIGVVFVVVAALGAAFFVRAQKSSQEKARQAQEEQMQVAKNAAEAQRKAEEAQKKQEPSVPIDTSNWKTYRSEKYGFEFKLSDEYSVPENLKNQSGKVRDVVILSPQKKSYNFSSRRGLEAVKKWGQLGDAGDDWAVKVSVFNYSTEFENNFLNWVGKSHDPDKYGDTKGGNVGSAKLTNGKSVNFFCWVSIGNDCSAFFTDKKSIIEVNTLGTDFFDNGKPDYFSSILDTFQCYH